MKHFLHILLFLVPAVASCSNMSSEQISIGQLQGAWWSQEPGPTAAFAIQGNEAWFDYDSKYHPVKAENNILIFDHGPEIGLSRSKIISLDNGRLVLQDMTNPSEVEVYTLAEPRP
jgi:hypothetical protein